MKICMKTINQNKTTSENFHDQAYYLGVLNVFKKIFNEVNYPFNKKPN